MKAIMKFFGLSVAVMFFASCNNSNLGEKADTSEAQEVKTSETAAEIYTVNQNNSTLEWVGSKPTGTHNGTVNVKAGELKVSNGEITGGKVTFDMTTIVNEDLEDPEWNQKLVGHLKSSDFFSVADYPVATFEITDVKDFSGTVEAGDVTPTHTISGNLTIKDISKNITFNANVSMSDGMISAESVPFTINRAEWDIKFKSKSFFENLKDDFIDDEVGLNFKIESSKS